VEAEMLEWLRRAAAARGVTTIRGTHIPTPRNGLVADLFERLGFERLTDSTEGHTRWSCDVRSPGLERESFVEVLHAPRQDA
jgi:predicted enzyme involved in methoxymalonyl-ACP biosynthesis